jgi:hypothetical protein
MSPEIGYGKVVHHILRETADYVRREGTPPGEGELDNLFDAEFYLPLAPKTAHQRLKAAGRRLVDRFLDDDGTELHRVYAVEREFELHLHSAVVAGRADVIMVDHEDGPEYEIDDYKVLADEDASSYERPAAHVRRRRKAGGTEHHLSQCFRSRVRREGECGYFARGCGRDGAGSG